MPANQRNNKSLWLWTSEDQHTTGKLPAQMGKINPQRILWEPDLWSDRRKASSSQETRHRWWQTQNDPKQKKKGFGFNSKHRGRNDGDISIWYHMKTSWSHLADGFEFLTNVCFKDQSRRFQLWFLSADKIIMNWSQNRWTCELVLWRFFWSFIPCGIRCSLDVPQTDSSSSLISIILKFSSNLSHS